VNSRAQVGQPDTARAAIIARAFRDQLATNSQKGLDLCVSFLAVTQPTGITVIENQAAGAQISAVDHTADVAAIAHRDHRQGHDGQVAQPAKPFAGTMSGTFQLAAHAGVGRQPKRGGGQSLSGKIDRTVPDILARGELDFFKANLIEGAKDPVSGLNLIIPPYVIIFLVIVVLGWLLLTFTKYGRRIYAVGSNPNAAYLAGVNVRNMKLSAYAINGLLVGIASVMMLARINVGIITLGQSLEIDTIAMAVIGGTALSGGKGNIWGTFFGVLLLGSIGNAMNMLRLPPEVQFVAKGVIIILAVSLGSVYANLSTSITRLGKHTLTGKEK
jgi:hypothetical protein